MTSNKLYETTLPTPQDRDIGPAHAITFYDVMMVYLYPAICIMGLCGNTLSFIVIRRCPPGYTSTTLLLSALAIADNIALIRSLLRWCEIALDLQIEKTYDIICKLYQHAAFVCVVFAAWLIVLVSFERFCGFFFPLKARRIFTLGKTKLIIVLLAGCILCLYSLVFIWWGIGPGQCDKRKQRAFSKQYGKVIRICAYVYVPLLILTICNISIIWKLKHIKQTRSALSLMYNTLPQFKRVTRNVLTVTSAYWVLTMPYSVNTSIILYLTYNGIPVPEFLKAVVYPIAQVCVALNHSVNFLIYVVMSDRFRKELPTLFKCSHRLPPSTLGSNTALAMQDTEEL